MPTTPFSVVLLQMPVTTGGYVTINPAAVVGLVPGNGPTCTLLMMSGIHYTLGSSAPDATSGDPRGSAFLYYYPTVITTFAAVLWLAIGMIVVSVLPSKLHPPFPVGPACFTAAPFTVKEAGGQSAGSCSL